MLMPRFTLCAFVLALVACASADIVPMGTDTYMISQTSAGGIFTNMGTLKSEVIQRANSFAESKGKVAIPVATREQPAYPGRMPNFEYQFKLVDRNDPRASGGGLIKTPDMVIENRGHAPSVVVNLPSKEPGKSPDVYAELLKLDDLRKKGIITEAEFEAQKRRLLEAR
jgi:Short C-terminal domain